MNIKSIKPDQQLASIQAMLVNGHKSIFIERHTPVIWGIAIAFLIAFTFVLSQPFFEQSQHAGRIFSSTLVGIVLFIAVYIDFKLTRLVRSRRDETISIVQKKVTYSIWLIFALALLLDIFANTRLGGGRKMFGLYVVLGGMAMSMFGMYSSLWWRWCGAVLVILGMTLMFALDPGRTLRYSAASVYIVSGLASAILLPYATTHLRCLIFNFIWILLASGLTLLALKIDYEVRIIPDIKTRVTLAQYSGKDKKEHVLITIPPLTKVPVDIHVGGDIFSGEATSILTLTTSKELEIEVKNGKPTGIYRVSGGKWYEASDAIYTKSFFRSMTVDKNGPALERKMILGIEKKLGGLGQ